MNEAVIFDLDGLLADTERLHRLAYQGALAEQGIHITAEAYDDHWVRRGRGIADYMKENGITVDVPAVRKAKRERYRELVMTQANPMPGAHDILRRLKGRKRLALATASYGHDARAVLDALEITALFEVFASNMDVERGKPHPDVFLYVAGQLGVEPKECVVLEDSEKGVRAARAAGMASIAVPNVHTRDHDFSEASIVVDSLNDVTLELIDSLN